MIRRLFLLLLLLAATPVAGQQTVPQVPPQVPLGQTLSGRFLEGSWGLRLDGSIVMRFDLERTADGWTGRWVKPGSFSSDGVRFGNIKMPAVERRADSGRSIGEWAEITFNDPRPGEEPDQFRIRLLGPDRAEMLYVGTGLPPFALERVGTGAILGPFEEGRVYGPKTARVAALPAAQPPQRASPPPAPRPAPPEEEPVQGPPAMVGR